MKYLELEIIEGYDDLGLVLCSAENHNKVKSNLFFFFYSWMTCALIEFAAPFEF